MGPSWLQQCNEICLRVEQVRRKNCTPQIWEQTAKLKDWGGGKEWVREKSESRRGTQNEAEINTQE